MFSEFLKIKPILDAAAASSMEKNLGARFTKIATGFGHGLKNIIKISTLGVGLALLNRLLNPLTEVEDRIKKLLEGAEDTADLADRLGTQSGNVTAMRIAGHKAGLKQDKVDQFMLAFAKGIETTREEALTPGGVTSDVGKTLVQFAGTEDKFVAMEQWLEMLRDEPAVERARHEKAVFGDQLFGREKNFINKWDTFSSASKIPVSAFTKENDKTLLKADLNNRLAADNEAQNLLSGERKLKATDVTQMNASAQMEEQYQTGRIDNYGVQRAGADQVLRIQHALEGNLDAISSLAVVLKPVADILTKFSAWVQTVPSMPWFRQIVSQIGK